MSWLVGFCLLVPLFPLVGAFKSFRMGVAGILVASLSLLGCAVLVPEEGARLALFSQVPLFFLLSGASLVFSKKHHLYKSDSQIEKVNGALKELKARHAALKEAVQRREQEEKNSLSIYGVAKSLAESLSWKDMAPRLATGVQKVFGAYEYLIYAIDGDGSWTQLQRRGNWAKEPPVLRWEGEEAVFLHPPLVVETKPIFAVPIHTSDGQKRLRNGVLFLKSLEENRSPEELLDTAKEFSAQLGVALKKALLFNQMEMHSRFDGLTGTLRRQPFMDRMNEELKRASVFHTPFSVMMLDIDHFKSVNDTHGHAAGDAVLTRVGQVLRESFYETDVVGRYGGEEFILLLPRAEASGVLRKAEALRNRFEKETIPCGFSNLKVTVSIGLSHFPQGGRTAEELIASADAALYRAKESGRNRVVAA